METTEEQAKVLEVKRQKSFWFADWSFKSEAKRS